MHDPRIGRFFAVDPLTKKYPELTPYQFSSNRTIDYVELEGLEGLPPSIYGEDYRKTFMKVQSNPKAVVMI